MKPFFTDENRLRKMRDEVSSWIGTPFRDGWRVKGVGCDCLQLAVAIYNACGLRDQVVTPPYTVGAWKGLRVSPILGWLDGSPLFRKIESIEPIPGDLLCFLQGRVVYHLGIYIDHGNKMFAHSITGDGVCLHGLSDPTAGRRLIAVYRPMEI